MADIFDTPLEQIEWDDINSFLMQAIREGERIDYKRELNDRVPASIAAMANTNGGVIIVGVDEDPKTKTPVAPYPGVTLQHERGGTLVNLCQAQLQPTYVPPSRLITLPGASDRGLMIIQVRQELAPIPIWERNGGVLIRIDDQNRPADLLRLRALLEEGGRRQESLRELEEQVVGMALQSIGGNRTYAIVGATIQRQPHRDYWGTAEQDLLAQAARIWINERIVQTQRSASTFMLQRPRPIDDPDPYIHVRFDAAGVALIQLGWQRDPFPIPWAIAGLWAGLGIVLSQEFYEAYQPIAPMEIVLGVVNWPASGLVIEDMYPLGTPQPFKQGGPVSRRYAVGRGANSWSLLGPFISYLCAEAGYRGFERYEGVIPAPAYMAKVFEEIGLRWII